MGLTLLKPSLGAIRGTKSKLFCFFVARGYSKEPQHVHYLEKNLLMRLLYK